MLISSLIVLANNHVVLLVLVQIKLITHMVETRVSYAININYPLYNNSFVLRGDAVTLFAVFFKLLWFI